MTRKDIKVSKGTIRIDNSDGTYSELGFIMPYEIADKIMSKIITWKDDWGGTVTKVEKYQESEKEFIRKLKKKK